MAAAVKPKPATRAKTSKRFVLRVKIDAHRPLTRAEVREAFQAWIDGYEGHSLGISSARVTNADIP